MMKELAGAALVLCLVVAAAPDRAVAQDKRCRVMDPTGTPLNLRAGPNGRIIGRIKNGRLVSVLERDRDREGKAWVHVADYESDNALGWVYREFISCF